MAIQFQETFMTKREDEIFSRRFASTAQDGAVAHDITLSLGFSPTPKQKLQKEWTLTNKGKVEQFSTAVARYPNLLTEQMLAARWHCSSSRLQNWRSHQKGPPYLKFGGRVLYRVDDVLEYEKQHLKNQST
jgi:hypothetical protein